MESDPIDSYASVNEQAGFFTTNGGFQVNVAGNTNLTAAVIASSEMAAHSVDANGKPINQLNTQTLTVSNIENTAEYSATGSSFSAGVGSQKGASAGNSNLSDDSNSVTVSAISAGTVNITNNTAQTAKTGEDAVTTVANLNRDVQTSLQTTPNGEQIATAVDSSGNNLAGTLTPIFDQAQIKRELQAQVQITQAFSQVAPRAVADYAQSQYDRYIAAGNTAEAENWAEGGIYRTALHTALGGLLTGDISGALGAGAVAGAAPLLNQLQQAIAEQLSQAGASNPVASSIAQVLAKLTSVGIGSAIGGTAGAGAALVVDTNNRQLHQTEIDWIKANARAYARQLNNGKEPTAQQIKAAEEDLAQQAFRQVQFGVSGVWDVQAYEFLRAGTRSGAMLTADPNFPSSGPTTLFFASPEERANSAIYLSSALNNTSFYQNNQLSQPTIRQINAGIADYTIKHNIAYNATIVAVALPTALLVGTVASAPTVSAAVVNFINTAIAACTGNLVLCINQAAIEAAGLVEGAPITATIAAGATTKAAQEIKLAAEELQVAVAEIRAVRGVTNPEVIKLPLPNIPDGLTTGKFGSEFIQWGVGGDGALIRLNTLTVQEVTEMQSQGLTRAMTTLWRDFYANEFARNANNITAQNRVLLMQRILDYWN